MSFDITVTQEDQRTLVVITGRPSLGQLLSLLQVLEVDSAFWAHSSVLFDLSGLEVALSPAEQARLGEEAHRSLPRATTISFRWTSPL